MKAVGYKKSLPVDAADALIDFEAPKPEPTGRDIRVTVKAISANPVDYKVRKRAAPPEGETKILGYDASGVVDAVGSEVTLFKPGDEVFGMLPYPHGVGSHAEYVTAPTRAFARKPGNVDHVQAAALPLAALTAWQALNDTARLPAGQRVLGRGDRVERVLDGAVGYFGDRVLGGRVDDRQRVAATAARPFPADQQIRGYVDTDQVGPVAHHSSKDLRTVSVILSAEGSTWSSSLSAAGSGI